MFFFRGKFNLRFVRIGLAMWFDMCVWNWNVRLLWLTLCLVCLFYPKSTRGSSFCLPFNCLILLLRTLKLSTALSVFLLFVCLEFFFVLLCSLSLWLKVKVNIWLSFPADLGVILVCVSYCTKEGQIKDICVNRSHSMRDLRLLRNDYLHCYWQSLNFVCLFLFTSNSSTILRLAPIAFVFSTVWTDAFQREFWFFC